MYTSYIYIYIQGLQVAGDIQGLQVLTPATSKQGLQVSTLQAPSGATSKAPVHQKLNTQMQGPQVRQKQMQAPFQQGEWGGGVTVGGAADASQASQAPFQQHKAVSDSLYTHGRNAAGYYCYSNLLAFTSTKVRMLTQQEERRYSASNAAAAAATHAAPHLQQQTASNSPASQHPERAAYDLNRVFPQGRFSAGGGGGDAGRWGAMGGPKPNASPHAAATHAATHAGSNADVSIRQHTSANAMPHANNAYYAQYGHNGPNVQHVQHVMQRDKATGYEGMQAGTKPISALSSVYI
jgi:hypothetical protein